jgi:hypothetical protein
LEEYRALSRQKECTDSYNKYYGNIINAIKDEIVKQIFYIKKNTTERISLKRKKKETDQEIYNI